MTRVNRPTVARHVAAYAALALLATGAARLAAQDNHAREAAGGTSTQVPILLVSTDPHGFTVSGAVSGLVPGRQVVLPVVIANPNGTAIKLNTLSAAAQDASAGCTAAADLQISSYDSAAPGAPVYTVPAAGSLTVNLTISLVDAPARNQQACKGATFPLSYSATAVSA